MIRLTGLELYNSIFNIIEEKNKIRLFRHLSVDEFSNVQFKDKVEEIPGLSDFLSEDL